MKERRIGDFVVQIRGVSYKPTDIKDSSDVDAVPLLRANNIQEDGLNFEDLVYVDKKKVSDTQFLRSGDILICSSSGSKNLVGKAAFVKEDLPFAFGAFCKVVRTNSVLPRYLGQFFQSPRYRREIADVSAGVSINNIRNEHIDNLLLPFHSDEEQTEIANILEKIDGLIAGRHKQLATLDELVKARFVEMFGTETEFNRWNNVTVGDVAEVCVGVVIKPTQYYTSEGIPAFRSLNIGEMYVKDADWVYFTKDGHQKNQKSVIRENDVLVVRSGAPGTACVVTRKYAGYNAVDIIIAHPNSAKINSCFLAAFTNMPHGMNQIKEKTGGAAQQHFNVKGYKELKLILPPIELQTQFAAFVQSTDQVKATIQASLDKLETLKKSLMQEYFG